MQNSNIIRIRKRENDKEGEKAKKAISTFPVLIIAFFVLLISVQNVPANMTDIRIHIKDFQSVKQNDTKQNDTVSLLSIKDFSEASPAATQPNNIKEQITLLEYSVPNKDTSFKAYMDYRTITDNTSKQYALQGQAYTDENGLRKIGDSYCVALGTYYAKECGENFLITLDTGVTFNVIVSDIKKDIHTDTNGMYTPMLNGNANLIEFIVDTKTLSSRIKTLGDVSELGFEGNIKKIERIVED